MKKQLIYLLLTLSLFSATANAQDSAAVSKLKKDSLAVSKGKVFKKKNTIYAELGGRAVAYSINYDRILWQNKIFNLSVRAGFTYFNNREYLIPLTVTLFTGKKKGHFELSYTAALYHSPIRSFNMRYSAFGAGYRYQNPTGKGLFFSATAYIIYSPKALVTADNIYVIPWAGIGIGKSF